MRTHESQKVHVKKTSLVAKKQTCTILKHIDKINHCEKVVHRSKNILVYKQYNQNLN